MLPGRATLDRAAVRIRIRQVCSLGLDDQMLVPSLLPPVRELVAAESIIYQWIDGNGEVTNAYAYGPASIESLLERMPDPGNPDVARVCACESREPDVDGDRHALRGLIREGQRVVGRVLAHRGTRMPCFDMRDASELGGVLRYIAHGVVPGGRGFRAELRDYHDSSDDSFVVADSDGGLRHASEDGKRMLLFASGQKIDRTTLTCATTIMSEVLREACVRPGAAWPQAAVAVRDTRWGRFVLSSYWLGDARRDDAMVGIRILRQEPAVLKAVRGICGLSLSPQQREIALMIARGMSNRAIANALSVSCNTVAYHVKQIFWRLDVHDRASLLTRIGSGLRPGAREDYAPGP